MRSIKVLMLKATFLALCSLPTHAASIADLPPELLVLIVRNLDVESIGRMCSSSPKMVELCNKNEAKLYRALINRDFNDLGKDLSEAVDFKKHYQTLFDKEVEYFEKVKKIRETEDPTWEGSDARFIKTGMVEKLEMPESLNKVRQQREKNKEYESSLGWDMDIAYEMQFIKGLKDVFGDRPTLKYFIKKFKISEKD